jgi:hypothetical protein
MLSILKQCRLFLGAYKFHGMKEGLLLQPKNVGFFSASVFFFEELKVISRVFRFDTVASSQDYMKETDSQPVCAIIWLTFCQKFSFSPEDSQKIRRGSHNIYLGRSVTLEDAGSVLSQ